MGRNRACRHRPEGFSLLELVIVLGIIVLLVALLMPAVSVVRKMSRSTSCLANLQQWGQANQMYRNNNHGHSVSVKLIKPPNPSLRWWELISPYIGNVRAAMLCPEAMQRPPSDPHDPTQSHGSASMAWWAQRGDWLGSYGVNYWTSAYSDSRAPEFIRFPARHADQVPFMADCCWPWSRPNNGDVVPEDLNYPENGIPNATAFFCIDRHRMAINIVFLDGHAEHVPLAQLWRLKWSETFVPRDVSVPKQ